MPKSLDSVKEVLEIYAKQESNVLLSLKGNPTFKKTPYNSIATEALADLKDYTDRLESDIKPRVESVLNDFMIQRLDYDADKNPVGIATKSYELIKELIAREAELVEVLISIAEIERPVDMCTWDKGTLIRLIKTMENKAQAAINLIRGKSDE